MYGVSLANNIIVASGSVVCNSFDQERIIIGGNPARIIGTWDGFLEKNKDKMMTRADFAQALETGDESKFVKRRVSRK